MSTGGRNPRQDPLLQGRMFQVTMGVDQPRDQDRFPEVDDLRDVFLGKPAPGSDLPDGVAFDPKGPVFERGSGPGQKPTRRDQHGGRLGEEKTDV